MATAKTESSGLSPAVDAVRAFNRFYTQRIGILSDARHTGGLSLTESRVLYELAHRDRATASALRRDLGLDQGYLSRILRRFEKEALLKRTRSKADKRQSYIAMTKKGRALFADIDRAWQKSTESLVGHLAPVERRDLVADLRRVTHLLSDGVEKSTVTFREPRVGDLGWLVHRHGVLYAEQFGWNEEFEAVVASIVAAFVENFDPARERCWIAERDGEIVGSIFLARDSDEVGRLRLLLVEPSARGAGIGRRLVGECVRQARAFGYKKLVLWTYDVLRSAGRIYQAAGFRLAREERQEIFGRKDIVSQDWELTL
jgi:DNA-binding MarR family transcriptional regulator/N-acetylglutamate synthase-like GNAT family acetyltransferase